MTASALIPKRTGKANQRKPPRQPKPAGGAGVR
jgi:hypothetical protein